MEKLNILHIVNKNNNKAIIFTRKHDMYKASKKERDIQL